MNAALQEKLKKIKMLILDVDGILTSGEIVIDHNGNEIKYFNVYDGFGIVLLRKAGLKTAIISARAAGAVQARAEDLKIDRIYQDAHPKTKAFQQLLEDYALSPEEVCFMADDLTDLGVLSRVGVAVTVPNAVEEVKSIADHITQRKGGQGAVREVVELILNAQGRWADIVQEFKDNS